MAKIDSILLMLAATTKLPISKDTLRYGSGDGGKTVHADDPKLNHLMKLAAKAINIKGHYVLDQVIFILTTFDLISFFLIHITV